MCSLSPELHFPYHGAGRLVRTAPSDPGMALDSPSKGGFCQLAVVPSLTGASVLLSTVHGIKWTCSNGNSSSGFSVEQLVQQILDSHQTKPQPRTHNCLCAGNLGERLKSVGPVGKKGQGSTPRHPSGAAKHPTAHSWAFSGKFNLIDEENQWRREAYCKNLQGEEQVTALKCKENNSLSLSVLKTPQP